MIVAAVVLTIAACTSNQTREIEHGSFLKGDMKHFVETVEKQLDGFSRAMMEVHYRYGELYWAGFDENWQYADYQLEHIVEAIEKGNERRPEHEKSALEFLGAPREILQKAIDDKNPEYFRRAFFMLNAACMQCHHKEDVSFINVVVPEHRSYFTRYSKQE